MVTSEDRKEVVKALYDLCDGCETVSDYDLAKALCLVAVSRNAYSSDSVLRIADLIKPERTCQMVDNGCELCCSECDRRHEYDDEPEYCMGCGAKVVEE